MCEPEIGSVLTEKVSLVLTDASHSTPSAGNQLISAHVVLSRRDMDDMVRPIGSVRGSGAHWRVFCSELMLYRCTRILPTENWKVEDIKERLDGGEENFLQDA